MQATDINAKKKKKKKIKKHLTTTCFISINDEKIGSRKWLKRFSVKTSIKLNVEIVIKLAYSQDVRKKVRG